MQSILEIAMLVAITNQWILLDRKSRQKKVEITERIPNLFIHGAGSESA